MEVESKYSADIKPKAKSRHGLGSWANRQVVIYYLELYNEWSHYSGSFKASQI